MARNLYGASPADVTTTDRGDVVPGVTLTVWDARTGGNMVTDLLTVDGAAATAVVSDWGGRVAFYGPDGVTATLWLDAGSVRLAINQVSRTGSTSVAYVPTAPTDPTVGDVWVDSDGTVPAAPGPEGSPDGAISVADHGAAGDGITDDTDAIQAAITSAGVAGGVWFPRGTYLVSSPIQPLRQQRLTGTYTAKYEPGRWPFTSGCTIVADPDFAGRAIIDIPPSSYGVQVDRLCLSAAGTTGSFAGVALPAYADNAGENGFLIRDSLISSCPGPGITGHMWVMDVRDTHIAQCSVGIHVTGDDGLLDTRIIGSQLYYNRDGGIIIDSDGWTGAVTIMGCRVERSGSLYTHPDTPTNPAAPGIAIRSGRNITLIGVETDANSGPGLEIGHATRNVYNVHVVGCSFSRDGGGDQTTGSWWLGGVEVTSSTPGAVPVTGSGYAGIMLDRCSHVKIVATDVAYGAADDSGAAGPISPMFGVSMQDTSGVALSLGRIEVIPPQNSLRMVGAANYGVGIDLPSLGLSTVPVVADATWLPTAGGIGCVVYRPTLAPSWCATIRVPGCGCCPTTAPTRRASRRSSTCTGRQPRPKPYAWCQATSSKPWSEYLPTLPAQT